MNTRVMALMSAQQGLITRKQAVEAGMSTDQIDRLVRRKAWTAVRKGVYAETAQVVALTSVRDQRLLHDRAASMRIRSPHVFSHHSSAYVLGLEVLHERPVALTHVTRPGIVGSHQRHGVTHHRAPYDARQVAEVSGQRVLGAARTACDISRSQGYIAGRAVADCARRSGVSAEELGSVAGGMKSWPYVTIVNDVVASTTDKTDSIGETLTEILVTSLGFGVPFHQFGLTSDGRTAWCDLCLGRHMFEFDGRLKYFRVDELGAALQSADEVMWSEKRRQDWICGFKTGMSRVTWDEAFTIVTGGPALERVQARLRREYLDTCQRFGTDITDLASYVPRGPRPRPSSIRPLAA